MKRLRILTILTLITSSILYISKKMNTTEAAGKGLVIKKEWLTINQNPLTPQKDVRPADQTFLTFPEWFLVFSPEEQANYFKKNTASSFPFMSHVKQFWASYRIINQQIKDNFPSNKGYHLMILVIGCSTTVEYSMKALYETIVGRLTDTKEVITEEDKFNAKFTQDYVDFIREKPWYEFDFKSRLKTLWFETSFFDDNFLRKIDRKYLLTSELLVKWGYGKLIGLGTKQVYDEVLPTTAVVLNSSSINHGLKVEKQFDDNAVLVYLPRYHQFNQAITDLATKGLSFKEIAGNNSAILLTVLVPRSQETKFTDAQTVFTQIVSSDLNMKRIALAIPVGQLDKLLVQLVNEKVTIEHVFDY